MVLLVLVIIICIYLRRPSIKEGLGPSPAPSFCGTGPFAPAAYAAAAAAAPGAPPPKVIPGDPALASLSGLEVTYNGKDYRTLTGLDPCGAYAVACEDNTGTVIPSGWKIADDDAASGAVVSAFPWNTNVKVLSSGKGYINEWPGGYYADAANGTWLVERTTASCTRGSPQRPCVSLCAAALLLSRPSATPVKIVTKPCPTPSHFGTGVVGDSGAGMTACIAGKQMDSGDSCNVKCDQGYKLVSGKPTTTCNNGTVTAASIQCAPITCGIPTHLGAGIMPNSIKGCTPGTQLAAGKTCLVECANGYNLVSGTNAYSCSSAGVMTNATLDCNPITCKMPLSLGDKIEGGGSKPCSAGGFLLAGTTCETQCEEDYEGASGNSEYSCSSDAKLTAGTLQCKKSKKPKHNIENEEIIRQNLTFVCDPTLEETTNVMDIEPIEQPYRPIYHEEEILRRATKMHEHPEQPAWFGSLSKVRPYDSIMDWWST